MAFIILEIDKTTDLGFVKKILSQLKFVKRIIPQQDIAMDKTDEIPESIDDSGFYELSKSNFSKVYSENEPDYSLSMLKEPNPDYESR